MEIREKWLIDESEYDRFFKELCDRDTVTYKYMKEASCDIWSESAAFIAEYIGSSARSLGILSIELEQYDRELAIAVANFLGWYSEYEFFHEIIPIQLDLYKEIVKHVRNADFYKNLKGNHA